MLAMARGRAADTARRIRQLDWHADQSRVTRGWVIDFGDHIACERLRIREHLFVIHDGPGRNPFRIQQFEPFLRRFLEQFLLHNLDEDLVILDPVRFLHETRIVDQVFPVDDLACQAPEALRRTADGNVPVGCGKDLVRGTATMPLTESFRRLAGGEEGRAFIEAERDAGFEQ